MRTLTLILVFILVVGQTAQRFCVGRYRQRAAGHLPPFSLPMAEFEPKSATAPAHVAPVQHGPPFHVAPADGFSGESGRK